MQATSHRLGLEGGMVVGVPIPKEDAGDYQTIEDATQQALREAEYEISLKFRLNYLVNKELKEKK